MIVRKEIIGDCTLYHGDMREILPTIGKVGCVLMDLPYKLTSGGNTTGQMGGKFSKENYDNSGSIIPADITFDEIMSLVAPVLEQGHAYFMVNNRHVMDCQRIAEENGFHFHNLLVWDKGTGTPNRFYMKNCEFTVFMKRGKARYINDCGSRQLIKCPNILRGFHDTEKPVALMEHYISNSTNVGEVVLDAGMGVGTTGIAAVNLSRKFIGIEIEQKYFDEACRRIDGAYKSTAFLFPNGSRYDDNLPNPIEVSP